MRGAVWRVVERCRYAACESLRLQAESRGAPTGRTILLPFDRPRPLPPAARTRVIGPEAWLRAAADLTAASRSFGGFAAAVDRSISILPYQLEPALLMRRDGVARILIADAVGLGKTIQAGLLLTEFAADDHDFRALVIVPAGLREQWLLELSNRFQLAANSADTHWLARVTSDLPDHVNPWELPGIYVASCDLIKRPEVLKPLENLTWDLVVVDEAHQAALGTARRAAVQAIARRARRVVLLTATPHAGDAERFEALCSIGAHDARSPQLTLFKRSRSDVSFRDGRRTKMLAIQLTAKERQMHRLLESYTARLWSEGRARDDPGTRLVAVILRKRALSSAGSLAASCRRRLLLLNSDEQAVGPIQLGLPLGEEDPLPDDAPDHVLAAHGLADRANEVAALAEIADVAAQASATESKIRVLRRFLSRVDEPVIVFTEYRDTLKRLARELSRARPGVEILHGGMDLRDRAACQSAFNSAGSLLLATDAASEGLNLHVRCRLIVHFELPWTPSRLEQRTGRVDRFGQARRVHELVLVAGDTAERLVLAPLLARSKRARSALPAESSFLENIAESLVATSIMEGLDLVVTSSPARAACFLSPPPRLRQEAIEEAERLLRCRRLCRAAGIEPGSRREQAFATVLSRPRHLAYGAFVVYELTLAGRDGSLVHREYAVAHVPDRKGLGELDEPRVKRYLEQHWTSHLTDIRSRWAASTAAAVERERAIAASLPSAASQLVQAGLFDRREVRTSAARSCVAAELLHDSLRRIDALNARAPLQASVTVRGVLFAGTRDA